MVEQTKCKSCGAEIIWITTKKGLFHPVDVKPKKMWVQDPYAVELHRMVLQDCYESHFAICPNADKHRRVKS